MKKVESYRAKKRDVISLALLSILLSSCEFAPTVATSGTCDSFGICAGSTGGGGGLLPPPPPSNESPFKVTLKSYWQDDEENQFPTSYNLELMDPATKDTTGLETDLTGESCEIPVGTQAVTLNSNADAFSAGIRTCGVRVPETKLFFSKLEFTVSAPNGHACDVVYTYPNFYLASRAKEFVPPWDVNKKVDCETLPDGFSFPLDKDCYSGSAKQLVEGFPIFAFHANPVVSLGSSPRPRYERKWLVNSAFKALNGQFNTGNKWTSFQPERIFRASDGGLARTFVGQSSTWHFQCVHQGSNLGYQYEVRIIPVPDGELNPGAPRPLGWVDDSGDVINAPSPISAFSKTRFPIEGGEKITLTTANPQISTNDSLIVCRELSSCTNTLPPQAPKLFCTINKDNTAECTLPALKSASQAGDYRIWRATGNSTMVGSSTVITYEALTLSGVTPDPLTGPASGGTVITLTGTGIAKNAKVTIGGKDCPIVADSLNTTFTQIQCTTPGDTLEAGVSTLAKAIKISNPTTEQEITFGTAFTYFKPVITSVGGTCTEGSSCVITLTGTFNTLANPYTVTVGGQNCSPVTNTGGNSLSCSFTPPTGSAGQKQVEVKDKFDQSVTATGTITVNAPPPPPPAPAT